jgi:hypothetical protein
MMAPGNLFFRSRPFTFLANIKCACLKVERIYKDVIGKEPVSERDDFIEKLTHGSYFIQVRRIKNNRYNLDKLLSIFEQSDCVSDDSEVLNEYSYQPDLEEIKIITGILHEMGVDPQERKRIEDEAEFIRTIDDTYGAQIKEQDKSSEEKDKTIEALAKSIEAQAREIAELKRLLRDQQR